MTLNKSLEGDGLNKKRIPKQFLGAFKIGHRFPSREYIDEEFSFELLKRAMQGDVEAYNALSYITKFNNEHYKAVVKRDGTDFYRTEQERLDYYNAQYARRMDVLCAPVEDIDVDQVVMQSEEDALIAIIDIKKEFAKSTKQ